MKKNAKQMKQIVKTQVCAVIKAETGPCSKCGKLTNEFHAIGKRAVCAKCCAHCG